MDVADVGSLQVVSTSFSFDFPTPIIQVLAVEEKVASFVGRCAGHQHFILCDRGTGSLHFPSWFGRNGSQFPTAQTETA